jgi:UDP-glucose 4-epimerase
METVFVVGGTGFIGRHLTRHLVAQGQRVFATYRPESVSPNVPGVNWRPCDLIDVEPTRSWPERYDASVYLAQSAQWRDFPNAADDVVRVNLSALQVAAEHARRAGARRFVHMSTGTVYGQTLEPAREDEPLWTNRPLSFYAAAKLAAELLLAPYTTFFGVTQLRLFMPYGVGQHDRMLLPTVVAKVREGIPVDLHGSEGLRCNPVAVRDVAETVLRCLDLTGSQTLNVAGPEELSLREVAEAIGRVVGRKPQFQSKPMAEPRPVIVGDTRRLAATVGWRPATRFADGLKTWLGEQRVIARERCA